MPNNNIYIFFIVVMGYDWILETLGLTAPDKRTKRVREPSLFQVVPNFGAAYFDQSHTHIYIITNTPTRFYVKCI